MKIKPAGTRIFVELLAVEERQTKGGIWLPDKHAEQSRVGTVLGVGPKVVDFKPGDRVVIPFYSGIGVDYPGSGYHYDTHRFLEQTEICGTLEE